MAACHVDDGVPWGGGGGGITPHAPSGTAAAASTPPPSSSTLNQSRSKATISFQKDEEEDNNDGTCVFAFFHHQVYTLALTLLSLQLTYILLDRVGKRWWASRSTSIQHRASFSSSSSLSISSPSFLSPRSSTPSSSSSSSSSTLLAMRLFAAYTFLRRRARQGYWRTHNAWHRFRKEWLMVVEEEEQEDQTTTTSNSSDRSGHLGGLFTSCLLLPLSTALGIRFLTTQLLPGLLSLLRLCIQACAFILYLHWQGGQLLAGVLGTIFTGVLPPPFDVIALFTALCVLLTHEHHRHVGGASLVSQRKAQAIYVWKNRALIRARVRRAFHRSMHKTWVLKQTRKTWRNLTLSWAEGKKQIYLDFLAARQLYTKTLGMLVWAGEWVSGAAGGGGGGELSRSVSLEVLEKEWAAIPQFPVRRAAGVCGICQERHAVLFVVSAACAHAFCRACTSGYLHTLLASGPFPARCPTCRVEDSNGGGGGGGGGGGQNEGEGGGQHHQHHQTGLCTRSVLKSLAAEGVTTPHHARRFLLQQCRAVADESSQDVIARTSKRCPSCGQHTTHYKNHGCHHIRPGSGCPSCGHHWCFLCLYDSGLEWRGCENECRLYCDDACSCPKCPDCQPGLPCDACDRDCPSCRLHA